MKQHEHNRGSTSSAERPAGRGTADVPVVDQTTESLCDRFRRVRAVSDWLAEGLEVEDFVVQSMPDVSPMRWHLAHTTWFFETFLLKPFANVTTSNYDDFQYLFNSYYNQIGEQFPRPRRGLVTRPTVREVFEYRREVDDAMQTWLEQGGDSIQPSQQHLLEVGLNHEQQHQELMLTDLKHVFSCNPLYPVYRRSGNEDRASGLLARVDNELNWLDFAGGVREIGHGGQTFAFDNESPRHEVLLTPFRLSSRLVTVGEFLEFIEDGGYQRPELWLSLGWHTVQQEGWKAPLYWEQRDGDWHQFTLLGLQPVNTLEPVCHVSFFEADAYARWTGARLATEAEWEVASQSVVDHLVELASASDAPSRDFGGFAFQARDGNFVECEYWHPQPPEVFVGNEGVRLAGLPEQMFGDTWEWTASPYLGYPGYRPPDGAIGEYNGKFMCNQYVLRGGSCATSASHLRTTYRNFFPPEARWQFTGIRLAQDAT